MTSAFLSASRRLACTALVMGLISGCASRLEGRAPEAEAGQWRGRLALHVASEPPQTFSAAFHLSGSAQAGELSLASPLGSTLAVMQWAPGQAVLYQGGQTRHYDSVDRLVAEATGTPLPLQALFGWLQGQNQAVLGWQADLSRLPDGRLNAQRSMPLPAADLRVVLER